MDASAYLPLGGSYVNLYQDDNFILTDDIAMCTLRAPYIIKSPMVQIFPLFTPGIVVMHSKYGH